MSCQRTQLSHVIIISLSLICYIQCGISSLLTPGIAAHDRCDCSHIFIFSFQCQCCAVLFIYIYAIWEEDSMRGSVGGEIGWEGGVGGGMGSLSFVSRLACLISIHVYGLLFSLLLVIEICYDCYQYYHYHYFH